MKSSTKASLCILAAIFTTFLVVTIVALSLADNPGSSDPASTADSSIYSSYSTPELHALHVRLSDWYQWACSTEEGNREHGHTKEAEKFRDKAKQYFHHMQLVQQELKRRGRW